MWFFSASIVDYSDYFEDFELRNGHIPKHVTISRRAYVETMSEQQLLILRSTELESSRRKVNATEIKIVRCSHV